MTRATFNRFSQVFSTRPSGMSRASLHETRSIFAASAASWARLSAVPRVPISPCVRSRMPVRLPCCAIFSNVPPQVCSTSSRWAAIAKTSSGVTGLDISVEVSLFQKDVFTHDQTVGSHFLQRGQDAVYVLIRIHEDDDHRKLSPSVYKVTGLHSVSAKKPSHGMNRGGGVHVLFSQIVENLHVQWPMMPLVGFVKIHGDLDCHPVWHFTAPAPKPCRPALRRDTAG